MDLGPVRVRAEDLVEELQPVHLGQPGAELLVVPVEPEHQAGAEGVVAVQVADPLQPAGVALPAADQDPAAVAGALDLAEGVERVVLDLQPGALEVVDLPVVPVELGASDLLGECGVVEGVAAVGQEGGADALVEQVLRGGAFGLVEVVPGVGAGLDGDGVLVGQREDLGAEAVFEGAKPGASAAGLGRAFGLGPVGAADGGAFLLLKVMGCRLRVRSVVVGRTRGLSSIIIEGRGCGCSGNRAGGRRVAGDRRV